MSRAAVIGSGSWGTALAQVLADNGRDCLIYGKSAEQVRDINDNHRNSRYLPGIALNQRLRAVNCLPEALWGADTVLLAVPTGAMAEVLGELAGLIRKPVLVINVAKGLEPRTHERMSQLIARVLPPAGRRAVVSLIGPSFAIETAARKLTTIDAVSADETAARAAQAMFANDYFRTYYLTDVVGAEYAAAIKNIIAIASGIADGQGLGDNARSGLMTRGLAEMTRFGVAKGAREKTFLGLCGVGDLILTCSSAKSRNYSSGAAIGQADAAAPFLRDNTRTVEGVSACRTIYEEAQAAGIEMPITAAVYRILYEGEQPSKAIRTLMERKLKGE